MTPFETEHLHVRNWRDGDLNAYAALMADASVMRLFPRLLDRAESARRLAQYRRWGVAKGEPFAPAFLNGTDEMVGFAGLLPVTDPRLPNYGGVELGWTLHPDHRGCGYATELARAWLARGFEQHRRIVAYTSVPNVASQAVARRAGFARCGTFGHPSVPKDMDIHVHILWDAQKGEWSG